MAEATCVEAGGKWQTAATWSNVANPKNTTTCKCISTSAVTAALNVDKNAAACQYLDCTGFTHTLKFGAEGVLSIGGAGSEGGSEGRGLALKLVEGMTVTIESAPTIKFVSSSATAQEITTAGKSMPNIALTTGSYRLMDAVTSAANMTLTTELKAVLDTASNNIKTQSIKFGSESNITLGTSTVTIEPTSTAAWNIETAGTLSAASSTIVVGGVAAQTEKKFEASNKTYGTITFNVSRILLSGTPKISTLNLSSKVKTKTIKATLTNASTTITMTEGFDAELSGCEISGTSITAGTTLIKVISEVAKTYEMSAAAEATVGVAEAVEVFGAGLIVKTAESQEITALTMNGASGEPNRLVSSVKGTQAKWKLPSEEKELTAYVRVRDIELAAGATLYLPNGTDLGNNSTNIIFTAKPAGNPLVMMI